MSAKLGKLDRHHPRHDRRDLIRPAHEMSFADELENFRMEEESAQQFFFGYLALQHIPGDNPAVLNKLNDTPTFWITARYSLLLAAFVALGRIFDQDHKSVHNTDKLL